MDISICLSVCLPACLPACLSVLSVCPVCLSCLSVCLSVYCIYLSIYLSIYIRNGAEIIPKPRRFRSSFWFSNVGINGRHLESLRTIRHGTGREQRYGPRYRVRSGR